MAEVFMPSDYELNASAAPITSQKQEYPPTQQTGQEKGARKHTYIIPRVMKDPIIF
jgi:hypothetical protein